MDRKVNSLLPAQEGSSHTYPSALDRNVESCYSFLKGPDEVGGSLLAISSEEERHVGIECGTAGGLRRYWEVRGDVQYLRKSDAGVMDSVRCWLVG